MIYKEEMIKPILKAAPNFTLIWEKFLEEWAEEDDPPLYLVLGDLARYIGSLIIAGQDNELKNIFSVVEQWHLEGDTYVKEAATVGLLEDLQNTNVVGKGTPEKIESYLLPESKRWWLKVNGFWESGKLIKE